MKFILFFVILLTPIPVLAQKPLDIVKISLTVRGKTPHQGELDKLLRAKLDALRKQPKPIDVVYVSHRAKYDIQVVVMPILSEKGFAGFTAAMLITKVSGEQEMSIYANRDLQSLTADIAETLTGKTLLSKKE